MRLDPPVANRASGHIQHTEIQPENTVDQPWYLVPFAQSYPDFQLVTIQHFISVTPTGHPLLAVIRYTLKVAHNYLTITLSIETGSRIVSLTTGTRL